MAVCPLVRVKRFYLFKREVNGIKESIVSVPLWKQCCDICRKFECYVMQHDRNAI